MIFNINNWFNFFTPKNKRAKTLEDNDIIAFGRKDERSFNEYQALGITAKDLKQQFLGAVSPDTNNQILSVEGEGDELVLSNGSLNGVPIPDSVIDMFSFAPLYNTWADTKAGKVTIGEFAIVTDINGTSLRADVSFSNSFPNASYTANLISVTPDNYSMTIENVANTGFTINLNSITPPVSEIYWSVIRHGEYS
jgi:hypothetical protein